MDENKKSILINKLCEKKVVVSCLGCGHASVGFLDIDSAENIIDIIEKNITKETT